MWFRQGKFIVGIIYIRVSTTLTRRVRQHENKVNVMTVDSHLRGNDIRATGALLQPIVTETKGVTVVNPKNWRISKTFLGRKPPIDNEEDVTLEI